LLLSLSIADAKIQQILYSAILLALFSKKKCIGSSDIRKRDPNKQPAKRPVPSTFCHYS
jgi:hypothetical protein